MNKRNTQGLSGTVRPYKSYGLLGGAALGAVFGVLVSGPHFSEWAAAQSLAVIVGFTALSAFIGYYFLALVLGASVNGAFGDPEHEEDEAPGPARSEVTSIGGGGESDAE